MSRSIVSGIALGVLIALTAASWTLAEGGASARWLAAIAVAKALVIRSLRPIRTCGSWSWAAPGRAGP